MINGKKYLIKNIIFLIAGAVLISGCSTDYFKDVAADRARDYIYDNCPNMSVQNESFIKYTYPRIETAPISTSVIVNDNPFNQVCFAWDLPDPKATIYVVGASSNYFDWHPIRMLIKPTPTPPAVQAPGNIATSVKPDTSDNRR